MMRWRSESSTLAKNSRACRIDISETSAMDLPPTVTANASRYGFARPYTAGRSGGYEEEKWHWSYLPLSRKFLAGWMNVFGGRPDLLSEEGRFEGSSVAGAWARSYVETINPECR